MSIKAKVISSILILLLLLATVITLISVNKSKDAMIKADFDKLMIVKVAKYGEIQSYLNSLKGLLSSLSAQVGTKEAFVTFENGFYKLQNELDLDIQTLKTEIKSDFEKNYLNNVNYDVQGAKKRKNIDSYLPKNINGLIAQYIFIVDNHSTLGKKNTMTYNDKYNSTYMQAHKKFHKSFNNLLKAYNLYDIFMVDLKGNVIYTDFKEKDFATNLKNGVYSNTGLSRAYKKALELDEDEIAFEDFAPYEPSYNLPASFIATPIFVEGVKKGVLVFQMPVDIINSIMRFNGKFENAGLGKSGECYLVGSDYMMRSNSRFQKEIKDNIVQALGTTIGVWEVKTTSTQNALILNNTGKGIIKNYRGKKVLSVYDVLDVFGKKWAIVAEISESEVLAPVYNLRNSIIIASVILLMLAIIISFFIVNISVVRPLKILEDKTRDIVNGKGDLTKRLETNSKDEISKVSVHINSFIKQVQETIKQANTIAKGDFTHTIKIKSKNDELGIALSRMTNMLKANSIKAKNEIWFSDGIGEFSNQLTGIDNTVELSQKAITIASRYIDGSSGVVYIYNKEKKELNLIASFAHTDKKKIFQSFKLGEGVVGQVALECKPILLKNIQNNEYKVQSGTTTTKANEVFVFQLIHNGELFGVAEIVSLHEFTSLHKDYLLKIANIFATALHLTSQNVRIKKLLDDSQKAYEDLQVQSEELQAQSEELQESNMQMEEQQKQLTLQAKEMKIKNNELIETKNELHNRAKELERASKYKNEFLANMSHELRTPLNSIILLSKLLTQNQNSTLDESDIKKSSVIHKAGNDLLLLINDILDLSKIESGNMELVEENIHSSHITDELNGLFGELAKDKKLSFLINDEFQSDFTADKTKLLQILKNLLSNSFKFTKEGSVSLSIRQENKNLIFEVSDTGIGIAQDKLDYIFEVFKQVDGSISREYGGTGLGLSISKTFADLMGGNIDVQSQKDKGSTFRVSLPLKKLGEKQLDIFNNSDNKETIPKLIQEDIKILKDKETTNKKNIFDNAFLDGKNVLIVDDDSRNIFTLSSVLQDFGAETYSSLNGEEAFNLLEENSNIDIILMDIMMPIMDGIETIKKVKTDERFKHIPIIVATAKTMQKDKELFLEAGADDYLPKPIDKNALISIIKAWVK